MPKTIGNPSVITSSLKQMVRKVKVESYLKEDDLRRLVVKNISKDFAVLDCGQSLRYYAGEAKLKSKKYETLDINEFLDYPDYLVDVCDEKSMNLFNKRYDVIVAFSLLEHCYDPFAAARSLFAALKPNGILYGSAPFLYPRHSPEDLTYQDYFRFTRDSYAVLFPKAREITLFPLHGRVATSVNILTLRYSFVFEKSLPKLSNFLNRIASKHEHALQTSGFGFVITK